MLPLPQLSGWIRPCQHLSFGTLENNSLRSLWRYFIKGSLPRSPEHILRYKVVGISATSPRAVPPVNGPEWPSANQWSIIGCSKTALLVWRCLKCPFQPNAHQSPCPFEPNAHQSQILKIGPDGACHDLNGYKIWNVKIVATSKNALNRLKFCTRFVHT